MTTPAADPDAGLWVTPAAWRDEWKDAPSDDARARRVLRAAQDQCEAFARPLAAGTAVPAAFELAVLYQARDLAQAPGRDVSSDTMVGAEGYAIRVRPLSAVVKALLRPKRAHGGVG